MKFIFESLGPVDSAEIDLNKLTIVCGKNNIGKTYLTYAVYGFFKSWKHCLDVKMSTSDMKTLLEDGIVKIDLEKSYFKKSKEILSDAARKYKDMLYGVLAAEQERFKNTQIVYEALLPKKGLSSELAKEFKSERGNAILSFNKERGSSILEISFATTDRESLSHMSKMLIEATIKEAVWGDSFYKPFIISSERTGIMTFMSELNLAKNRLIDYAQKMKAGEEYSPMSLIESVLDTGYPMPVSDNIDFVNSLNRLEKKDSQITSQYSDILKGLDDLIGGVYKTSKEGDVSFVPKHTKQKLKMSESSSAVRSLVILSYYIRYKAKKNDLLIIDEPELNLHPSNQTKMARLVARLVNAGINVFITTHSDYFIKELNTLIMLRNEKAGIPEIKRKYGYQDSELLSARDVSLYTLKEKELFLRRGNKKKIRGTVLVPGSVDPNLGIEVASFDETIERMNEIQDKIYDALVS